MEMTPTNWEATDGEGPGAGQGPAVPEDAFLHLSDDEEAGLLVKMVFFGEALRALGSDVSEDLLHGEPDPMITLMDDAFERIAQERPGFTPEEYTLFVMSMLLQICEDPKEEEELKMGAAHYVLRVASQLPADFAPILADAHALIRVRGTQIGSDTAEAQGPILGPPVPISTPRRVETETAEPQPEPMPEPVQIQRAPVQRSKMRTLVLPVVVYSTVVLFLVAWILLTASGNGTPAGPVGAF